MTLSDKRLRGIMRGKYTWIPAEFAALSSSFSLTTHDQHLVTSNRELQSKLPCPFITMQNIREKLKRKLSHKDQTRTQSRAIC